jgi:DnaK suppressor protein
MEHLNETEMQELKDMLESEGYSLEQSLTERGKKDAAGEWTGASIPEQGEESDPNDVADNIEELAINVAVVEEIEQKQRDIVDALEKIDEGTYGVCEECGEEIPIERLRANPAARTCIAHA